MMNEQNQNPINGQAESRDQQNLAKETQRLADSIEQALDQADSEGSKWKQQFQKEWGCQVVVECEQQPFQVTLMVLPVDKYPDNWRLMPWVDLPAVRDAAGVWPAIQARAKRLDEIGKFHRYINFDFDALRAFESRDLLGSMLSHSSLIDTTGFGVCGGLPEERKTDSERLYRRVGQIIDRPLEAVLADWINCIEKQVPKPQERLKSDLSKVEFKFVDEDERELVAEDESLSDDEFSGLWRLEVDGVLIKGTWNYWTFDGNTKVVLHGYHFVSIPKLAPDSATETENSEWEISIYLALTDQDFNARPGMLEIYEEMGGAPVYTPADEALDGPTLAELDYNINP